MKRISSRGIFVHLILILGLCAALLLPIRAEAAQTISTIDLDIQGPLTGETLDFSPAVSSLYRISGISWSKSGGSLDSSYIVEPSTNYWVSITLVCNDKNHVFADKDHLTFEGDAIKNFFYDKTITVKKVGGYSAVELVLAYQSRTYLDSAFDSYVPVTFDGKDFFEYYVGDSPDFNFSVPAAYSNYYAVKSGSVRWYPTGSPSAVMKSSDVFVKDTSYTVELTLSAKSNTFFTASVASTMNDGYWYFDTVSVSANRKEAVFRIELEPFQNAVRKITIGGIAQPKAQESPQTEGFTVSEGVTLGTPRWEGTFNSGLFQENMVYQLVLPFSLESGYESTAFLTAADIATNLGTVKDVKYYEASAPEIVISLKAEAFLISYSDSVANLKAASSGKNRVTLTWSPVNTAEGYLIYGQKNGSYGYVGMVGDGQRSAFNDTKALDTDYNYYWVFPYITVDGKMYPGPCPKYVFAKGVCAAVTNLKASSVKGGVKLSWDASYQAEGYLVYGIVGGKPYGYVGMITGGTAKTYNFIDKKASATVYNYYWMFPYHKDAGGNMIVGLTGKYTYGRALK